MYEMKQLSQRKVTQTEAAAYFDAVFNNTSLSIANRMKALFSSIVMSLPKGTNQS
jgi:ribosomal protein S11